MTSYHVYCQSLYYASYCGGSLTLQYPLLILITSRFIKPSFFYNQISNRNDIHAASLSISPATTFTDDCGTKQYQYQGRDSPLCSYHQRYWQVSALVPFNTPGSPWSGLRHDCLCVELTVNIQTLYLSHYMQNNMLTVLIRCDWSVWLTGCAIPAYTVKLGYIEVQGTWANTSIYKKFDISEFVF